MEVVLLWRVMQEKEGMLYWDNRARHSNGHHTPLPLQTLVWNATLMNTLIKEDQTIYNCAT